MVERVTKDILKLLKDMEETLIVVEGLGLAAPQIGVSFRVCLARINRKITPLINPKITWRSTETETAQEGCLSLPGLGVNVPRALRIIVRYQDTRGKTQERELKNLNARVVQHEVDHLDGILIVDYMKT